VLFTVEGRGEEKRCYSCTRTGADSFFAGMVEGRGGDKRCFSATRPGANCSEYGGRAGWRETVFFSHTHRRPQYFGIEIKRGGIERCSFRTCVKDGCYGDVYGTSCLVRGHLLLGYVLYPLLREYVLLAMCTGTVPLAARVCRYCLRR
jgi:hypothetical protein